MGILIFLLAAPTLGVLWFLNLIVFLKKLVKEKDTSNQVVLGAVLTFFCLVALMFPFISLL